MSSHTSEKTTDAVATTASRVRTTLAHAPIRSQALSRAVFAVALACAALPAVAATSGSVALKTQTK